MCAEIFSVNPVRFLETQIVWCLPEESSAHTDFGGIMRKISLISLALAAAVAILPAAKADSFSETLTFYGAGGVTVSFVINGSAAGGGVFDISSGTFTLTGSQSGTGSLYGQPGSGNTAQNIYSPSGYFWYDNLFYQQAGSPLVDIDGLLFEVNGVEYNIYYEDGEYWLLGNNGFAETLNATTEPSTLLLLGTGILCLAGFAFRKSKNSGDKTGMPQTA
jgi:PEP-CTERM motif-containing protein